MDIGLQTWLRNVPLLAHGAGDELLAQVAGLRREAEIYPPRGLELRALEVTAFEDVRVVLLGQDPYHGPGQAHGLAFSVPQGLRMPPSLRNVFKEIDASLPQDERGGHDTDLTRWAEQGVLLLNSVLTVQAGKPGSHSGLGWQELTDAMVAALSDGREGLVFLLWGNYARAKGSLVDSTRHLVLEAAHPSPFSAHRGFLGCNHFSLANEWLAGRGGTPIVW